MPLGRGDDAGPHCISKSREILSHNICRRAMFVTVYGAPTCIISGTRRDKPGYRSMLHRNTMLVIKPVSEIFTRARVRYAASLPSRWHPTRSPTDFNMCVRISRNAGFNNGLSLILNITGRVKGARSWPFLILSMTFPRVSFSSAPRPSFLSLVFLSLLSPYPRGRSFSRALLPRTFFPAFARVSLDFLPAGPVIFSLAPFSYFILASSRGKLYTSPSHFSRCPLPSSYVPTVHRSRRRRPGPLGSFSPVTKG